MQTAFHSQKGVALIVAFLVFGLAACGVTSTANGTPPGANATAAATATLPPGATATCPATAQGVAWPTAASADLTPAQPDATVKVGQSLEVVLPVNAEWHFAQPAAASILQLQQPAGYYDASRQSCVWRFTAQAKGTTTLNYTRTVHCTVGTKCSQVAMALPLTVTVN